MKHIRTPSLAITIISAAVFGTFHAYKANAAEPIHEAFQSAVLECSTLLMKKDTNVFRKNSSPPREIKGSKETFQVKYKDKKEGGRYTLAVSKLKIGAPFPNSYSCAGIGSAAPIWATFKRKVFLGLKSELQALGFTQLDYSNETILFANCKTIQPDSVISFTGRGEFPISFSGKHFKGAQKLCSKHKVIK